MTIDELARRVDMTARNIREWQTNGLLPPPQRRGRIGIYTDDHISRIERIKSLRAQGFPLDISRRILDQHAESASEVRRLASEVLGPANPTGSVEMKRVDLADRFGGDAERQLSACGLVEVVDDDLLLITDTSTFGYVEKLTAIGLPLSEIAAALSRMAEHQVATVQALVDLCRDEIWTPFVEAGLPDTEWHNVADKTIEMRSLAIGLGIQAFRRAIDEVGGRVLTEEAAKLNRPG
ncbi:MerR family transcriptional regulator [Mycobacterium vicinigordonae]|uniref:MerR family transcriptional regulator n=1 Tax=Mycobacterium vicinigordonae TaxID=1719132 RepID=A0A7D6INQ9_9MYCO|nr:MerR family transcriptional regulator [Mycobacterium vicinigordonae]QLL08420.1 MerR family transcriptional regulator [Mycobacterium vicinigordonae]